MAKSRTINIKSVDFVKLGYVRNGRGVLEVHGPNHIIKLHLGRDDIDYLARFLWVFVEAEEKLVAETKRALRGEDR